jgi:hypothetical protein
MLQTVGGELVEPLSSRCLCSRASHDKLRTSESHHMFIRSNCLSESNAVDVVLSTIMYNDLSNPAKAVTPQSEN